MLRRELTEPSTEPLLRLVRNRHHVAGLAFAATGERDADGWPVLIMPRGFDQYAAHERVAGARDAAAPMRVATRVLAGHEPEVGHQRARRGEPAEIMQLGENQHRRQRVDPAEAPQPADWRPIRVARQADFPCLEPMLVRPGLPVTFGVPTLAR